MPNFANNFKRIVKTSFFLPRPSMNLRLRMFATKNVKCFSTIGLQCTLFVLAFLFVLLNVLLFSKIQQLFAFSLVVLLHLVMSLDIVDLQRPAAGTPFWWLHLQGICYTIFPVFISQKLYPMTVQSHYGNTVSKPKTHPRFSWPWGGLTLITWAQHHTCIFLCPSRFFNAIDIIWTFLDSVCWQVSVSCDQSLSLKKVCEPLLA